MAQSNSSRWTSSEEEDFKVEIEKFFRRKLERHLKKRSPLEVGNSLASILRSSENRVVEIVTPRAVTKWASKQTLPKWKRLLRDRRMLHELREIGKSIANTMRPLAGNNFASWVAQILNKYFVNQHSALLAITSGSIKQQLSRALVVSKKKVEQDWKPDIDIVVVDTSMKNKVVAIISAKTTLAERVMQTINWNRYKSNTPRKYRNIKLYLVTAWEDFSSGVNRERVQELDGVFVCNTVREYGAIKRFSKIGRTLQALSH